MLDVKKILSRAWHILWNYRMLWVFGFILALTVAGSSGGGNGGGGSSNNYNNNNNNPGNNQPFDKVLPGFSWHDPLGNTPREKVADVLSQFGTAFEKLREQYPVQFQMVIAVAIVGLIMILVFSFIGAILRYVAETATIRMVNEYEQSGVKVGFWQGWKYGWSRASWRLFLINFLVHIPSMLLLGILILIGWWIVTAALSGVQATLVTSLIAGIGLTVISILVTVVLMVILYVVRDFAWRISTLEDAGVMQSLNLAGSMLRRNWKNAGLMWLVMIGIKIAMALIFFLLIIPLLVVSVITSVGGLIVALVPSLLTAGIASLLSAPDFWPWVFAVLIGLPFFGIVAFSPVALVRGWGLTYESSIWTLTYRELKALETVAPAVVDAV